MRRALHVIGGVGVLLAAVVGGGGPASAQECGGYLGGPCEEFLEFQYPATVTALGPIAIEGSIREEGAAAPPGPEEVEFEIADQVIGSLLVQGDGTFAGTLTVPDVAAGDYTIVGTLYDYVAEGAITVLAASSPPGGDGGDLDCPDITGTTIVTDDDPNDLDADGDGIGCEEDLTTSSGSAPLARTGFDATPMITLGAAALLLGAAAVYGSARRRLA